MQQASRQAGEGGGGTLIGRQMGGRAGGQEGRRTGGEGKRADGRMDRRADRQEGQFGSRLQR